MDLCYKHTHRITSKVDAEAKYKRTIAVSLLVVGMVLSELNGIENEKADKKLNEILNSNKLWKYGKSDSNLVTVKDE